MEAKNVITTVVIGGLIIWGISRIGKNNKKTSAPKKTDENNSDVTADAQIDNYNAVAGRWKCTIEYADGTNCVGEMVNGRCQPCDHNKEVAKGQFFSPQKIFMTSAAGSKNRFQKRGLKAFCS